MQISERTLKQKTLKIGQRIVYIWACIFRDENVVHLQGFFSW